MLGLEEPRARYRGANTKKQGTHVILQPRTHQRANKQAPPHQNVVMPEGGEFAKRMRTQCSLIAD